MLRLDQLAPTMGVESWIMMAGGAFLLNLCFGEFHRSRRLDVTPTDLASKHLLECAGALRKSRRDYRQREMAAGV